MLLVLDASVIVKWFKEEINSNIALKIRDEFYKGRHEIIVPDLLLYEISNALRYDKKFNQNLIEKALRSLFEMDIVITIPSEDLISDAVKLALKMNITVYDAIYISLANQVDGIFITADERFFKSIKNLKNCKLLRDF
jgi:predicted nucleic acid-binding protein